MTDMAIDMCYWWLSYAVVSVDSAEPKTTGAGTVLIASGLIGDWLDVCYCGMWLLACCCFCCLLMAVMMPARMSL